MHACQAIENMAKTKHAEHVQLKELVNVRFCVGSKEHSALQCQQADIISLSQQSSHNGGVWLRRALGGCNRLERSIQLLETQYFNSTPRYLPNVAWWSSAYCNWECYIAYMMAPYNLTANSGAACSSLVKVKVGVRLLDIGLVALLEVLGQDDVAVLPYGVHASLLANRSNLCIADLVRPRHVVLKIHFLAQVHACCARLCASNTNQPSTHELTKRSSLEGLGICSPCTHIGWAKLCTTQHYVQH